MIIKDYYIKNDLELINDIIKLLIKNNINYLYIKETNELHFDNYIIRFKKNKDIFDMIYDDFFNILNTICDNTYNEVIQCNDFIPNNNFYKKNNFKHIKKINTFKINTKGISKNLKKQLNPTRKIYK